jgi:hypothetical protein
MYHIIDEVFKQVVYSGEQMCINVSSNAIVKAHHSNDYYLIDSNRYIIDVAILDMSRWVLLSASP